MLTASQPPCLTAKLDIADRAALAAAGLHPDTGANLELFSQFSRRPLDNLRRPAISPRSGRFVSPARHFGIDSDPWMHAILYPDAEASFIVFCRGLTETSVLGGVYLPAEGLLLENRSGWYFNDVFRDTIDRNLGRATDYFALPSRSPGDQRPLRVTAAIGNRRVGDYIMQLAWLEELTALPPHELTLDRVLVNRSSEFFDVGRIFPELRPILERQASAAHIEHRARHLPGSLLSDVRSLAHLDVADRLRARFARAVERLRRESGAEALTAPLAPCPITIWTAVELEKRVWAEQFQALPQILTRLAEILLEDGEPLGLVLSGLTATEDGVIPGADGLVARERQAHADLVRAIRWPVRVVDGAGLPLSRKAVLADRCDLVLGPIGSASVLPSMLFSKPGVLYGARAISRAGFQGPDCVMVPDERVIELRDRASATWTSSSSVSYSLDGRHVLEVVLETFAFVRDENRRLRPVRRRTPSAL